MLEKAIRIAKGDDVKKVGMSIKMPVTLKEELTGLAESNNVSTNSLICSLLQLSLDETMSGVVLLQELERVEKRKESLLSFIDENQGLDDSNPLEKSLHNELKSINSMIATLKGVLS